MDLLQAALIFLILLLSIFLGITGIQVFLILRDLKKALDKLNKVLESGEKLAEGIEKPVAAAGNVVAKAISGIVKTTPKQKRFYKKIL